MQRALFCVPGREKLWFKFRIFSHPSPRSAAPSLPSRAFFLLCAPRDVALFSSKGHGQGGGAAEVQEQEDRGREGGRGNG